MAEQQDSSQEKTEEPTPKKLKDAKDKGQVARSKELNTLAVVMVAALGLLSFGAGMAGRMLDIMRHNFSIERAALYNTDSMGWHLMASIEQGLYILAPLFFILLIASLVGPVLLGGWLFSAKSMAPKFSRMNPLSGLKRMFSMKALMELAKALAKFLVVLTVALIVLGLRRDDLLSLGNKTLPDAIYHSAWILSTSLLILACSLIVIAMVDIPFQIYDNKKKLKMTKQEVKDEYKDSEGKPEVKAKVRQLQREVADRKMLSEVPNADVVITNPTHFAVALKYDPERGGAPMLVAKGGDFMAQKIREIAQEHQVLVLESPPLARAVFYTTEVDREIPAGLYLAVAQVLAYVFQLQQYQAGKGKKPPKPPEPKIPEDLQH
ncbi:MAG: flagellar biosynthesis protein FlhB [Pseudomonadaceae bacterium]|nr:MAG: flagellar biosynthesis protein FlhB [Pseudomonadaceae bacterium]